MSPSTPMYLPSDLFGRVLHGHAGQISHQESLTVAVGVVAAPPADAMAPCPTRALSRRPPSQTLRPGTRPRRRPARTPRIRPGHPPARRPRTFRCRCPANAYPPEVPGTTPTLPLSIPTLPGSPSRRCPTLSIPALSAALHPDAARRPAKNFAPQARRGEGEKEEEKGEEEERRGEGRERGMLEHAEGRLRRCGRCVGARRCPTLPDAARRCPTLPDAARRCPTASLVDQTDTR